MADEPGEYVRQAHAPDSSSVLSFARAIRALYTRDAQRTLNGCSRFRSLRSPRAAGVPPLYTLRGNEEEPWAGAACALGVSDAMVLCVAEQAARRKPAAGTLKILFQPAEETLLGALALVDAGAIADVDAIVGIHLRPEQEAKKGQATPALCHGSSGRIETTIEGMAAHGGRPHLGVNAIDAAAWAPSVATSAVASAGAAATSQSNSPGPTPPTVPAGHWPALARASARRSRATWRRY